MFENFHGNAGAAATLRQMIDRGRIHQTLLFEGPEGVGKATLARRFGAALLGSPEKIEADDQSLSTNRDIVADREKWTSEKRNDEPLYFATHPDFITVAPDGPLRQISISQMRWVREQAQYKPLKGNWRVILIDRMDRANEQAANSLLKTLEEPPPHLVIVMTAENAYDLLPTIRSRSVPVRLAPLANGEIREFLASRGTTDGLDRRVALANGAPGIAVDVDLDAYDKRRAAALALLEAASGITPFGAWVKYSEAIGASKSERLEDYLRALLFLLEDLLLVANGGAPLRNPELGPQFAAIARRIDFAWMDKAVRRAGELAHLAGRNIQKGLALDALVVELAQARGR